MKLQLGEIRSMIDALPAILKEKLPVKSAYWLARVNKELQSEFQPFEEAREGLVREYAKKNGEGEYETIDRPVDGVTDVNGEPVMQKQYVMEDMEGFNAEYAELAEEEIEIKYEPLSLDQLGDIQITGIDILRLGRLIKEE